MCSFWNRSGGQKSLGNGMSARIIQVRPSRNPRWQKQNGWEVFEAEGICPVYGRDNGWERALEKGFLQRL